MADTNQGNRNGTDAATQPDVAVLAGSPAEALAAVYQTMAQAIGIGMQNAVAAQQQMYTISQAVTSQCVNLILTQDTAAVARAASLLSGGGATSGSSQTSQSSESQTSST